MNYFWAFFLSPGGRGSDEKAEKARKQSLILCVAANLLCLFVFKYATFAMTLVTQTLGLKVDVPKISLPLGISFFIFQAMSYSIDVYRGRSVAVNRSFVSFAAYIAMFPQLVAGPIVRYVDIAAQLRARVPSMGMFVSGIERFIFGLAKKIYYRKEVELFSGVNTKISLIQKAFVDEVLGINEGLSGEELNRILWEAFRKKRRLFKDWRRIIKNVIKQKISRPVRITVPFQ